MTCNHTTNKLALPMLVLLFILSTSCKSQENLTSRIVVKTPSIEEEATSVWRTINDIEFYESQGYKVHLPKDSIIDALIVKSKTGNFGNDDYPTIYNVLESKVFNASNYLKANELVSNELDLLHAFLEEIHKVKDDWDWQFKSFDTYQIQFTLYGTGGSYDPNTGVVTLLTDSEGNFMNYKSPANTIIHEISHMGMEESIVQKYHLPHGMKERIVDTFVSLMFKEKLPNYRIQNMGDSSLDDRLRRKEDLKNLDSIVKEYVSK